jgi:hypothetical protein
MTGPYYHPQYGWIPADPHAAYGDTPMPYAPGHGQSGNGQPSIPPAFRPQPWPPPANARPNLNVDTYQTIAARPGVQWKECPVAEPLPLVPVSPDGTIAMAYYTRTLRFTGLGAGQSFTDTLQFDTPAAIFKRMGSVRTASGNALVLAGSSPLALFDVQFARRTTGDTLDIEEGMASNLLGTAERPDYIGGRGWMFDNGNSLSVTVTPAIAGLVIDVTLGYVSFLGPQNYTVQGG